ncbi:MAG: mechanosensitive ion channel protein MscS [Deltaproteobacteria bacterium]|nr:MAG: mechanosensitive ion channel protein MscS [Desulfobacterales bacterium]PIE73079.1 MAG: mechanosensitive ion channel protein MscS [Deltaproteobacteria bacterium]
MELTLQTETVQALQSLLVSWCVKVVLALLVFFVGRWVARRVVNLAVRCMQVREVDVTLIRFLEGVLYYALLISVILAAVGQLGVKTSSFLAVLGAASLAVGLALKDSLANFSSGVMLILFRPFRVGDTVEIAGEAGVVQAISVFSTILHTPGNERKIIPNGAISNATITNITANPTRRINIIVGISYDDDLRQAKELLEQILREDGRIHPTPVPLVAVFALGAYSVDLVVRGWVDTPLYWEVLFSLNEKIKLNFDENSISLPYPQQDIHLFQAEKR